MGGYILKDRHEVERRVEAVFAMFPILRERSSRPAKVLSGGEQQMLLLGRALVLQPEIIMLDEPSLGLAPKVARQIFDSMDRLRRAGMTDHPGRAERQDGPRVRRLGLRAGSGQGGVRGRVARRARGSAHPGAVSRPAPRFPRPAPDDPLDPDPGAGPCAGRRLRPHGLGADLDLRGHGDRQPRPCGVHDRGRLPLVLGVLAVRPRSDRIDRGRHAGDVRARPRGLPAAVRALVRRPARSGDERALDLRAGARGRGRARLPVHQHLPLDHARLHRERAAVRALLSARGAGLRDAS